ncbi:MAG: 2-C-methyl-D-erythritol 4-phosphate cytidylyltransferase [Burkholderiales bacterium]|nr:2-C-methyl-D-erythritol 4-phosphate cytidylyltransferase [Burkholderiales bacterium]
MSDLPENSPADSSAKARCWALIPCAGMGSRMGLDGPKQYQSLAGKPMVLHTLAAFADVSRISSVLVVVSPGDSFLSSYKASWRVADCGGASRAQSVSHGLEWLLRQGACGDDWVLVHDAARCLITPAQINRLIETCETDPVGGLLAQPVADTLKCELDGRVASTLRRSDKWLAQTPQMFRIDLLRRALAHAGPDVTDESSAIESLGLQPLLVRGSAQNFKLTYPEDFALAQALLEARSAGGDDSESRPVSGEKGAMA